MRALVFTLVAHLVPETACQSKARPKDSTLTLISGNELSSGKTVDSKARYWGSFSYFKNKKTLAALYGPQLAR